MTLSLQDKRLTPSQMLQDLEPFMAKITTLANDLALDIAFAQADHIALRINDWSLAEQAHHAWQEHGEVISQAKINGRPIIVFKFFTPLRVQGWHIECLELPYPAADKLYPTEGWEHVEFVFPSHALSADEYLADLLHTYPAFGRAYQDLASLGIKSKLSSPKGEGERLANPTVALKRDGVCIKLHPHTLSAVVASEQA